MSSRQMCHVQIFRARQFSVRRSIDISYSFISGGRPRLRPKGSRPQKKSKSYFLHFAKKFNTTPQNPQFFNSELFLNFQF